MTSPCRLGVGAGPTTVRDIIRNGRNCPSMNGGTLTMGSGIFQAVFQSGEHTECGIAIISRGTIHGGFASFYYRGTYKEHEGHTISGTLEFHKYAQLPDSIFDKRQGSRLVLNRSEERRVGKECA